MTAMLPDDVCCPRCAKVLEAKVVEGTKRPACTGCGRIIYYDPKVSAVAVVERNGKILMVQRAVEPGVGLWSLPGGYVNRGEVVERAVEREIAEETAFQIEAGPLLEVSSEAGNQVILISYDCRFTGGELRAGPEVTDASFFDLSDLPPLAFPRDIQILETWKRVHDKDR